MAKVVRFPIVPVKPFDCLVHMIPGPGAWLGGRTEGYHSDHQPGTWLVVAVVSLRPSTEPGTWTWDHMNETIEWFDWHDGEPNNFGHNENCLALREYHDPFFPIFRDYFWNDMNCDSPHHYICENRCAEF